jgi:hypothetical protein
MRKICIAFLLSNLLLAMPLWAQEVFITGDNQAAAEAKLDLEKFTNYKFTPHPPPLMLEVRQESWSPGFKTPATVAVTMKLLSPSGKLLWSKTEPIGSRSSELVVQDLLRELAKADLHIGKDEGKTATEKGRPSRNK